jgi:hypothetical protein
MDDRRDMTNVLLAGLLGLHTVNDADGHASGLPCLGMPGPLDDTELLHRTAETQKTQSKLAAQIRAVGTEEGRGRHLRLVTEDDDPQDVLPARSFTP